MFALLMLYAGKKSFFSDEMDQLGIIVRCGSLREVFALYATMAHEVAPPLFAMAAFLWSRLMPLSQRWLQALPALAACVGVFFVGRSGRLLSGKRTAVLASLLACAAPAMATTIGTQFRQYGFVFLFASLTVYAWLRRLRDPGKPRVVSCYSNLDSAELYFNGRSLGEQPLGETCQASWTIPFEPGSLQAVCKGKDGSSTETWLHSPQGEAALKLRPVEKSLPADGQAVWQVELRLLDEAGQLVTDQDALVALSVTGGNLLGIENGHIADLRPYSEPARATHWGRAIAYVRAGTAPGELTLTARREGRETRLSIPLVAPKPEPLFLP